jgi:hypothetical protein
MSETAQRLATRPHAILSHYAELRFDFLRNCSEKRNGQFWGRGRHPELAKDRARTERTLPSSTLPTRARSFEIEFPQDDARNGALVLSLRRSRHLLRLGADERIGQRRQRIELSRRCVELLCLTFITFSPVGLSKAI